MPRVRDIQKPLETPARQVVADYFKLLLTEVTVEPQPDAFSVDLRGNDYAKEQYKKCNPFGNTSKPNIFDFTDRIYVRCDGSKVYAL